MKPTSPTPDAHEPWTWFVPSRSRPKVLHKVEIDTNGFRGQCGCENFTIGPRGMPSKQTLAEARHNPAEECFCFHIIAAREAHCVREAAPAFLDAMDRIKPR